MVCAGVCMGMGIVRRDFTAPVSDWVWGGLYGSESNAGQPAGRPTGGLGLLGCVPAHSIPPPPAQTSSAQTMARDALCLGE